MIRNFNFDSPTCWSMVQLCHPSLPGQCCPGQQETYVAEASAAKKCWETKGRCGGQCCRRQWYGYFVFVLLKVLLNVTECSYLSISVSTSFQSTREGQGRWRGGLQADNPTQSSVQDLGEWRSFGKEELLRLNKTNIHLSQISCPIPHLLIPMWI